MLLHALVMSAVLTSFCNGHQKVLNRFPASGPFDANFSKLADETIELWRVPGLSIAVVDGDDVWAEGYGIAEFPETPVTPSTLFYCGSTTKAFTAAGMSLLVDDNEKYPHVKWDTPISSLIRDDFVLEDEYATTHTTIEDALSHRSGFPRHDYAYGNGRNSTAKDLVRSMRHLALTAQPRTTFQYCNLMFVVASHVIETLEGKWLGDFLKEKIWTPLKMKSTYFSNEAALAGPEFLAQGYVDHEGKYKPVPLMEEYYAVNGAGAVISNVLDYSKWLQAMINKSGPISKAGHRALRSSRSFSDREDDQATPFTGSQTYTLGWFSGVYKGYEYFQHSGGMEAFGAQVIFFPSIKYGAVSFGNTGATSNAAELRLIWQLIDDKLGVPEEERFDWNKRHRETFAAKKEEIRNAPETYFPDAPSPTLPHTLPLSNYTGTFYHPGYHFINVEFKNDTLFIHRTNAVWHLNFFFRHISGDYFVANVVSDKAPGFESAVVPAEFRIGSDGKVKSLGMGMEPQMGKEARIWFDKV